MSQKQSKKLQQKYRRDIKGQFNLLRESLRERPRFFPKWLWRQVLYFVLPALKP